MTNTASSQQLKVPAEPESTPSNVIVLIVDDEPLNRFLISEALASDHYQIVEAESGEAALEYMSRNDADLILLDIDMPGMGGIAACEAIRALPHGKLVPIAMVTGLDDSESIAHAFDCGATDFLTKPVNWTLIQQRVRFMLRHGSITRKLQRSEQVLEQVHEIADIGHWEWDIANRTIYFSEQYRRILPGTPSQLMDSTLDSMSMTDFGKLMLARIREVLQNSSTEFSFECSADIPSRGRRRLLYHGTLEYSDGKPLRLVGTAQDITQRYQDEERFAVIFDESPVGIVEADCSRLFDIIQKPGFRNSDNEWLLTEIGIMLADVRNGMFLTKANPVAQRMLLRGDHNPQLETIRKNITLKVLTCIRNNERQMIMQMQMPLKSGENRTVIISTHLPHTPEEFRRVIVTISDITDLVKREEQLKRADVIIANSRDAIAVMDKHSRVLSINPAFTQTTGYTLEERQSAGVLSRIVGYDCDDTVAIIRSTLKHQDYWRGEIEHLHRDGSWIPGIMQVQLIRNEKGEADGFVTIMSDISEIKESEKRLYQLAHFDSLTGLPNRFSLHENLQSEFKKTQSTNGFSLLYIDLDGFKLVNDSMGHPTGDALLRDVSARLQSTCRPGDLLTRIGGDEFALMMFSSTTHAEIEAQAERIFDTLKRSFHVKGREIYIGASIGACHYPGDANDADEMLRNADSAMYEAKRLGRGQLSYYSTELTTESNYRLQIENELRAAVASDDQLFLVYQPKYDAVSGTIVGTEALVRWHNPRRGLVMPGEFIGIAEASKLIIAIGEWAINEACRQLAEWQHKHALSIPVAINISALHLREESLIVVIGDAIARHNIDPRLLEIEITEDSLDFRGEDDKPYIMLNKLSELGLAIAIDDFGTGYSSLSQLKKMPISTLKIDISFVRDIVVDESDHAIISAIVALAKKLNMTTVAEGVENEEQAQHLRALECNVLQGYLYSKPLPADELLLKLLN